VYIYIKTQGAPHREHCAFIVEYDPHL